MAGTPSRGQHKPRRKGKAGDGDGTQASRTESLVRAPSFPLAAFLWPTRGSVSQWEVLPLILMAVGLFRWAAGLWGYSGELNGSRRDLSATSTSVSTRCKVLAANADPART